MATHTTNYNLSKPEASDAFSAFRQSYNDNMDIIDQNLGGGGGGSSVAWNQIQASGDKIAEITINGTSTDVYSPTVPTKTSDLTNDSGFLTSSDVSTVAMTGDYDDLLDKPSIPSKTSDLTNDEGFTATSWNQITGSGTKIAEITIDGTTTDVYAPQSGGDSVSWSQIVQSGTKIAEIDINGTTTDVYAPIGGTVTDVTVNGTSVVSSGVAAVIVPTKTSDLTNDSDFVSDASYVHTDNNFTTAEKTKLSGIESGAEVNVQSDWSQSDNTADDYIKNKPTIPTKTSDLANDSGFLDSSDITVTQIQTTGTKIATIDVDGTSTDLYAPSGGGGFSAFLIITAGTGLTVTASSGGTTLTATETSTGTYEVMVDAVGTWTVSDGTNSATVVVSAQTVYYVTIISVPDGSTVTPTDDVQILLNCANIWDKTYTTISELIADSASLGSVIADNNAIDYLVRSTTFASAVCADQTAMSLIGLDNYASNTFLSDSTWSTAILGSAYKGSVLNVQIPYMTSNTSPSGICSSSSNYPDIVAGAYKAFQGSGAWLHDIIHSSSGWVKYEFPNAILPKQVTLYTGRKSVITITIQASVDDSTWDTLYSVSANTYQTYVQNLPSNTTKYKYFRILNPSNSTTFIYVGLNVLGRIDV